MKRYRVLNGQHLLHDDLKADDAEHVMLILTVMYPAGVAAQFTIQEAADEEVDSTVVRQAQET